MVAKTAPGKQSPPIAVANQTREPTSIRRNFVETIYLHSTFSPPVEITPGLLGFVPPGLLSCELTAASSQTFPFAGLGLAGEGGPLNSCAPQLQFLKSRLFVQSLCSPMLNGLLQSEHTGRNTHAHHRLVLPDYPWERRIGNQIWARDPLISSTGPRRVTPGQLYRVESSGFILLI